MENLIKEAVEKLEKIKEYLIEKLDDFIYVGHDQYSVMYAFNDNDAEYYISIWISNGKEYCGLYDFPVYSMNLNSISYTDEEREKLYKRALLDKEGKGNQRKIEKRQIGNDLFFEFYGDKGIVKFFGYNDCDWWTKYRPAEIKEGDTVWEINLKYMTAVRQEGELK